MYVPKIMHFIWVGPTGIPDHRAENICQFMRDNPDFNVQFWVDIQGTPEPVITSMHNKFAKHLNQIQFCDISKEGFASKEVRYEIDRLRPNYGAASDLLRYHILAQRGGLYIDSDVESNGKPLHDAVSLNKQPIWDVDSSEHKHFFVANENGTFNGANDMIICTANNHTIAELAKTATQNFYEYRSISESQNQNDQSFNEWYFIHQHGLIQQHIYSGDMPSFQGQATLSLTGPGTLLQTMKEANNHLLVYESQIRYPLDSSDAAWVMRRLRCNNLAEAIQRAMVEIQYEVDDLHILCLDTHINNICASLGYTEDIAPKQVAAKLFSTIASRWSQQELHDKIQHVQMTFKYPEVVEFYQKQKLTDKADIFPYTEESIDNVILSLT